MQQLALLTYSREFSRLQYQRKQFIAEILRFFSVDACHLFATPAAAKTLCVPIFQSLILTARKCPRS